MICLICQALMLRMRGFVFYLKILVEPIRGNRTNYKNRSVAYPNKHRPVWKPCSSAQKEKDTIFSYGKFICIPSLTCTGSTLSINQKRKCLISSLRSLVRVVSFFLLLFFFKQKHHYFLFSLSISYTVILMFPFTSILVLSP